MRPILSPQSRETRNTLFTVLSNHRRRYVLHACNLAGGEATLSDVAEQVAAWEYDKQIGEVTSAERKRVYTSIQQHHLSKLEKAELVEVTNDRISTTNKAKNLDVYLEIVPEQSIPWAVFYLGLSTIGAFSLGIAYFGWFPEPLSTTIVAALFVVAVGISALVHLGQSQRMEFGSGDFSSELDR